MKSTYKEGIGCGLKIDWRKKPLKETELRCPWGCSGSFELDNTMSLTHYYVRHVCEYIDEVLESKCRKTEQGAMKSWNSWMEKK